MNRGGGRHKEGRAREEEAGGKVGGIKEDGENEGGG